MTSHLKGPTQADWSVFAEKVVEERDEVIDMLELLVTRRLRASYGNPKSSDGRYEAAIKLLKKHGIDVMKVYENGKQQ